MGIFKSIHNIIITTQSNNKIIFDISFKNEITSNRLQKNVQNIFDLLDCKKRMQL